MCELEVNSAEGEEAGDRVTEGKRGGDSRYHDLIL